MGGFVEGLRKEYKERCEGEGTEIHVKVLKRGEGSELYKLVVE